MANTVFLPGVNTVVNGLFGPWAALINGGIAFANIAPWLGELTHLTGSAPAPIKDLHKALADLYDASNSSDFEAFQAAARDVEDKIAAITAEPSKDNFKNCGRMTSWESYLAPLKALQEELTHFRTRGIDGYSTSRLETPLKVAVVFLNEEIRAHTGVVYKALSKVAQEAKKVARHEFGGLVGGQSLSLKLQSKLSPLQKVVHDLTKFRTDGERYFPGYVQEELLSDLQALNDYHSAFNGIHRYVIQAIAADRGSLLKDLDTHVVAYIRKVILPQIQRDDFHQAYYQAALKLDHVHEDALTDSRAGQIAWGRERVTEGTNGAKEVGSLLAAVSFTLEMSYFDELAQFAAQPHDSPTSLHRKVRGLIALIESHPSITLHPEFRVIEGLARGLLDQTYQRLGKDSIASIQAINELIHQKNFGGALLRFEHFLANPTQRKRETTLITQGVAALKEQARAYGVPESMLAPVDTVAEMVDSKLQGVLQGSDKDQKLAPFAKLNADLDLFHADRANRSEITMERALIRDLRGTEAAYPELRGIVNFVRRDRGDRAIVDIVDQRIAAFIEGQVTEERTPIKAVLKEHSNQFHLSLYHANKKDVTQTRLDTAGQIEEGQRIWREKKYSPVALMQAMDKVFEARALRMVAEGLVMTGSDSLEDLSRKVDIALGALATHPPSGELSRALELVYGQVQGYIERVAAFAGEADEPRIDQAQSLARKGDFVGALKALKEIFDQGTLLSSLGASDNLEPQISAVAQLAVDFEEGHKVEEGTMNPERQTQLIALEERKFAHNLSLFTTFKVIAKRKGWDTKTTEENFEEIIKKVDEIEYDGSPEQLSQKREREAIFKEELNKLTNVGTIDRFVNWIVFKLVKHFTSQFSKSIIQGTQTVLVNPLQRPTKGHHGMLRAANNGILGLLFAERIWREDGTGQLGIGEKDDRLIEILQDMNHKGRKGKDLIKEVVDKALEEFNTGEFSRIGVFNSIATFVVKKMAQLIVNRMHLADSVLETMSDRIYSERHPNYSLDILLLNQIKEIEKILGEEGAELIIKEGDNGKRLAQQLVDNLFQLLKERKVLTPEDIERQRGSLLERLQDGTDTIVKGVLRDLILFGIEQFQKPERMNQTVLEVLRHANRALRPSEATLLRELFNDKSEDVSAEDLIALFEAKYPQLKTSTKGMITRQECEAALAIKYQAVEKELHESMDRIISKAVGGVVEAQVETLLKTPRQSFQECIQWVHEQFTPYRAHLAGKTAYTNEIESLVSQLGVEKRRDRQEHLIGEIKARHEKFLIQMENQLKRLKSLKTEAPSAINRQINRFYLAINQLQMPINDLNNALATHHITNALNALDQIRVQMMTVKGALDGIEASLSYQELSPGEKAKEAVLSGAKHGAEVVKPYVSMFLNHHIQGSASEMVFMYKARSTFASMMQQGVFRTYLEYQPSPDDIDPDETIASDLQRTFVMVDKPKDPLFSDGTHVVPFDETVAWYI